MSAAQAPSRRRRAVSDCGPAAFIALTSAARLHLCSVPESPEVRLRHMGALLAWTTPLRDAGGNRTLLRFRHGPTAMWVAERLASPDAELLEVGGDGGVVAVVNPQRVLGPFGFRDGRWLFGQGKPAVGIPAAEGVVRGAVHAAGVLHRNGLRVSCPTLGAMLTLTAMFARLGIQATPHDGDPVVAVKANAVEGTLARLGIPEVGDRYRHLRDMSTAGRDAQ